MILRVRFLSEIALTILHKTPLIRVIPAISFLPSKEWAEMIKKVYEIDPFISLE